LVLLIFIVPRLATAQGYAPGVAPKKMAAAQGLTVTLVAGEPDVRQPILVKFDGRGRLWTIQYLQYPNPAGLKRITIDRFSRTVYDRVPEPPPKGPRGDDRITICHDTDGDGRADRFTDFVAGLNLCTGLELGHGGVFVLQVPYLLFYPDRDRDDVPDGAPDVLLDGFGMDDAQSLANHLTWGPDGWLYGVTGSTSNNRVRGLEFQQAVWRFHPRSKRFELFCEGGGNLFGLTFDADGNLFFSSNGIDLAYHAVQGGYYRKNFGKHGPLHNPYAYGFFEHLPYDEPVAGPRPGGTIYLGDALPPALRGAFVCCEFLQHSAAWWRLAPRGSTFEARYGGPLVEARDTWFCAPDLCQGPDGAIYLCDFHDQRTAHPDPDAQWDRNSGRIYRLAPPGTRPVMGLDIGRKTSTELCELLHHPNGWYADRARVELATRRDPRIYPALSAMARETSEPRRSLQGLWGLYITGGWSDALGIDLLRHPSEYVRAWAVRLLGDEGRLAAEVSDRLVAMAEVEPSVVVRCQLAATARRLPGAQGVPIIARLLRRGLDRDDPYIPLMLWWAVEANALSDADDLLRVFATQSAWNAPATRECSLRLLRRYAAEGTRTAYRHCEQLLASAPAVRLPEVASALEQGLAERSVALGGMGLEGLFESIAPVRAGNASNARGFEPLTTELAEWIARLWHADPADLTRLELAMRAQIPGSAAAASDEATNVATRPERRVALLGLLAKLGGRDCVPLALGLLECSRIQEVQSAALDVLDRFGGDEITPKLLDRYTDAPAALRRRLRSVLLGRSAWARAFLDRVNQGQIAADEVPPSELKAVALHNVPALDALVRKHWGRITPGTAEEKLAEIRRLGNDLRAGHGDHARGKALFGKYCATCHKLFGEGAAVGPDLTGVARNDTTALLASIVDPGAVVRPQYLQCCVVTSSGRIVTGILAAHDKASVTLVDAQGQHIMLPRDQVEQLRDLPGSIMPEDLLKPLRPQEVRDLFGYLQSKH
jgi:putative heme-binding domain-containing protein